MEKFKKALAKADTLKKLDTLIENIIRLRKTEFLPMAHTKRTELSKSEAVEAGRRPDIKYLEIGLSVGDAITHTGTGEVAYIETGRTLVYKGIGE